MGHRLRPYLSDHVFTEMSGSIHVGLELVLYPQAFQERCEDTHGIVEGADGYPQTGCGLVCKGIIYQHGFQTIIELKDPIVSFIKIRFFDTAHENPVACFVLLPKRLDRRISHRCGCDRVSATN